MARSRVIAGALYPTFVTGNRNGRTSLPGAFLTGSIEPPPVGGRKGLLMSLLGLTLKQVTAAPPVGTGTWELDWIAPMAGGAAITGYALYFTTGDPITGTWTQHGTVGPSVLTYTFDFLANGVPHYFKAVPITASGEGLDLGITDGTPA